MSKEIVLLWGIAWCSTSCDPVHLGLLSDSVYCRCNASHCDSLHFDMPPPGTFLTVTSDKAGRRLAIQSGTIQNASDSHPIEILDERQTVRGFGGALTDSALLNLAALSNQTRQHAMSSWFGVGGAFYSLLRLPIGGCDFSTRPYSLDDHDDDFDLGHFNLSQIDLEMRLPFLRIVDELSDHPVALIGSAWSPPVWLKTTSKFNGIGRLRGEPGDKFHKTWANYYVKYIKTMERAGFPIWAITSQNEPSMGLFIDAEWNALGWTPRHQMEWLKTDLIPAFAAANLRTKLVIFDDNRILLPQWVDAVLVDDFVRNHTDGIALHWYWDGLVPVSVVSNLREKYPEQELIASEACSHRGTGESPYFLAWHQGEDYSRDIIQNLQNHVTSWIDWNLALDRSGGPNWAGNHRNAGVIVDGEKDEFFKAPSFYHLLHFSRFIPPGSKILRFKYRRAVVAQRPDGYKTVVILNDGLLEKTITIKDEDKFISLVLPPHSIQSVVWR